MGSGPVSDLEFYLILFGPTVIGLTVIGLVCWGWINPNVSGRTDGKWDTRQDAEKYSGLRRIFYEQAYRKHHREPEHPHA